MEWRPIDDYENYSISSTGQVRNNKTERIMKLDLRPNGYYQVGLSKNGKTKTYYPHRLVALAFIPLEPGKDFVDHKDGHPENNSVENLRWCTQQENTRNRTINKNNTSGYKGVYKMKEKWCAQIKIDGKHIYLGNFDTAEEAAAVRSARAQQVYGVFTNACEYKISTL
jgi:hypothetical protein